MPSFATEVLGVQVRSVMVGLGSIFVDDGYAGQSGERASTMSFSSNKERRAVGRPILGEKSNGRQVSKKQNQEKFPEECRNGSREGRPQEAAGISRSHSEKNQVTDVAVARFRS